MPFASGRACSAWRLGGPSMSSWSVSDQCSSVCFGADRRRFLSVVHLFQRRLIPSRAQGAHASCSRSWTTCRSREEQPPPAQHSDSVQGQAGGAGKQGHEPGGGGQRRDTHLGSPARAAGRLQHGLRAAPGGTGRGRASAAAQRAESQGRQLAATRGLGRTAALFPRRALSAASLREGQRLTFLPPSVKPAGITARGAAT